MSTTDRPAPPAEPIPAAPPPSVQIFGMFQSALVTQLAEIAAEHHLADLLAAGPRSSTELSEATGLHEPSLYRALRAMTGLGLVSEQPGRRFAITPVGAAMRDFQDMPWISDVLHRLGDSVRTGTSGMRLGHGMDLFEFLEHHPEQAARFVRTMAQSNAGEPAAVAEAYDFSGLRKVVDVGGGNGTCLSVLLGRHPHLEGVLFDQPSVIGRLPDLPFDAVGGDFFAQVPPGGDAYLLSHIIHDWSEDDCVRILRNCREAMTPDGRVLIVEMVIPPGDDPAPGKMLDMLMLVFNGPGMERTEEQYAELLDKAGFELTRVVPTTTASSVVEAYPR